jgi:hypothetical protein
MTPTLLDPTDTDPLAGRLAALPLTPPSRLTDPSRLAALPAVRRITRRRQVRRSLAYATAGSVLIGANGVAAYYAPVYAQMLGDAPGLGLVSGPALAAAGLSAHELQPMHDSSNDHGITATLVGGYADGLRTTLIIGFAGVTSGNNGMSIGHACRLSDQFGQNYALVGGWGIDVGPYPMHFQPLRGAAARVGARLTVSCDVTSAGGTIGGLTLHATLLPNSVRTLATPAPVVVDGSTYQVAGLRLTGDAIEVHTVVTGAVIDAGLPMKSYTFPGMFLVSPTGEWRIPFSGGGDAANTGDVLRTKHILDETRLFSSGSPGTYRLVATQDSPGPGAHVLAQWTLVLP